MTHGTTFAPDCTARRPTPGRAVPIAYWSDRRPSGKMPIAPPRWSTRSAFWIVSSLLPPRYTGRMPHWRANQPITGTLRMSASAKNRTSRVVASERTTGSK